ncbi:MAG TPA: 3-dehydroquinate synthase [Dehalococcoidia bacterium]|nr:3-dehydroquinate synthase [Dehalococcoidia bacterium]
MSSRNIFLTGFSYTGKTTVGRHLAAALGWRYVDSDEVIEERAGRAVPDIFAQEGEPAFREWESRVLADLAAGEKQVIATGGGTPLAERNRALMRERGFVICLEAAPATIHARLLAASADGVERPLLAGGDPLARITFLKEFRQPYYATADWVISTDRLSPEEVAEEARRAFHRYAGRTGTRPAADGMTAPTVTESLAPYCAGAGAAAVVKTSAGEHPIFIGWGNLADLGRRMRNAGLAGRVAVISDAITGERYGEAAVAALRAGGLDAAVHLIPPGEASKSLAAATEVYRWLADQRFERRDAIVALGGGVVGDLAGFVAATYLRGVAFVQVPTTLLAMVDSSIGGKTAVNLPHGKNLVGAFYQPRLVLSDVSLLQSLPARELASGWAEVIKHGLILDRQLFDDLAAVAGQATQLDPDRATDVIARSAAIKAAVVTQDERETGPRLLLNYGHTIGHAIENVSGYGALLHGEAVAVGIHGAALIGERLGLTDAATTARQLEVLRAYGLPVRAPGLSIAQLRSAMKLDKKVVGSRNRWILLEAIGRAAIHTDVPDEVVDSVLTELTA